MQTTVSKNVFCASLNKIKISIQGREFLCTFTHIWTVDKLGKTPNQYAMLYFIKTFNISTKNNVK